MSKVQIHIQILPRHAKALRTQTPEPEEKDHPQRETEKAVHVPPAKRKEVM